jgi:hypothetical protein
MTWLLSDCSLDWDGAMGIEDNKKIANSVVGSKEFYL